MAYGKAPERGACRHCEDVYFIAECPACGKKLKDQCPACHAEIAHGIITEAARMPVHLCGNEHYNDNEDNQVNTHNRD